MLVSQSGYVRGGPLAAYTGEGVSGGWSGNTCGAGGPCDRGGGAVGRNEARVFNELVVDAYP